MSIPISPTILRIGHLGFFYFAPDFAMASFFLITWFHPYVFGPRAPWSCGTIMGLEFLSIIVSILLIRFLGRVGAGFGVDKHGNDWKELGCLMLVVAVGLILVVVVDKSFFPIAIFGWHVYAKATGLMKAPDDEKPFIMTKWILVMFIFFIALLITVVIPWPHLGWDPGRLDRSLIVKEVNSGRDMSYFPAAFGTFYFFLLGLMSIYWPRIANKMKFRAAQAAPPPSQQPPVSPAQQPVQPQQQSQPPQQTPAPPSPPPAS